MGGGKELDGGCSFIKQLEDNLPPLSFSSIKNVPCMKKPLDRLCFELEPVLSAALS